MESGIVLSDKQLRCVVSIFEPKLALALLDDYWDYSGVLCASKFSLDSPVPPFFDAVPGEALFALKLLSARVLRTLSVLSNINSIFDPPTET